MNNYKEKYNDAGIWKLSNHFLNKGNEIMLRIQKTTPHFKSINTDWLNDATSLQHTSDYVLSNMR